MEGQYSVAEDNGNKYVTMKAISNGTSVVEPIWRTQVSTSATASCDGYIVEYRVRPNWTSTDMRFATRADKNNYGPRLPVLYRGNIYSGSNAMSTSYGTYTPGEWITITNVFHNTLSNNNIIRDTYINGVYACTDSCASTAVTNYVGGGDLRFTFNLLNATANDSIDVDYIKVVPLNNAFAAQLTNTTDVAADKINVKFNNVPTAAELLTKVSVKDAEGNSIAISGVEYVYSNNVGNAYAQSVNLVFAERLAGETTYTLAFNGLTDTMGNSLTTELSFETDDFIEYGTFTEGDGTVSITINNVTETTKTMLLIYAGYVKNDDDSVKMKAYTAKIISVIPGEHTYSTDAISVDGCDYTQAYLWEGMTSVIPAELFTK